MLALNMREIRFLQWGTGLLAALGLFGGLPSAEAKVLGACDTHEFSRTVVVEGVAQEESLILPDGTLDALKHSRVIRNRAPLYDNPDLRGAPVEYLTFNQVAKIEKVKDEAILIASFGDTELGWVAREDLLCLERPARSEKTGLEQKLFIQTGTVERGERSTVTAFPSSGGECEDNLCRELSRFETYFVFGYDTSSERYLIADSFKLDFSQSERGNLIGWVHRDHGILWETAHGLRPAEDLRFTDGPNEGEERAICVYPTVADARSDDNCQPLLGGDRWYRYPLRAPILGRLEEDGGYYRVALPVAQGSLRMEEGSTQFDLMLQHEDGVSSLKKFSKVDVFFLIDGTRSMQPYIDQIVGQNGRGGFVSRVLDMLENDEAFYGADFRFGYQIYRDTYAGDAELSEGFPLSSDCDANSESMRDAFQDSLARVRATEHDRGDDDYHENVFGGIFAALDGILNCPEHQKILFIVGDHGYSAQNQDRRGQITYDIHEDLLPYLAGDPRDEASKSIITFFVQTPNSNNRPAAVQAYDDFYRQGLEIARGVIETQGRRAEMVREASQARTGSGVSDGPERAGSASDYVLRLNDENEIIDRILSAIRPFVDQRLVNELMADLRGGASLVEAIERLQGTQDFGNLPGLAWDIIEARACSQLESACTERVYDTILKGVVLDDPDIIEEVWLTEDGFSDWEKILDSVTDLSGASRRSEIRQTLLSNLIQTLTGNLGEPSFSQTGERLGDYLKRASGLPIREDSKLLSYSLQDFGDETRVSDCEIARLTTWLQSSRDILTAVRSNNRPIIDWGDPSESECETSRDIPVVLEFDQERFADPEMRYSHSLLSTRVFWIPEKYLP